MILDLYHSRVDPHVRINQLDLTRAGIFSVQKNPLQGESWEVDFEVGGVLYRVQGNAAYGRPYGVDSDVLLALQTLFWRAGCPDTNLLEVSPIDLLRLSGLDDAGKSYERLREALLRLSGVRWTLSRTRFDVKRDRFTGGTVSTGLISDLRLADSSTVAFQDRQLDARIPVHIVFTAAFADAIRDGLIQMLDGDLLERLSRSASARALYRVLQAHRVQLDGSLVGERRVSMRDWVRACAIDESRADNAKRVLTIAHDHLLREGYLKDAAITGRGFTGEVTYQFLSKPQPELAERLMARGVPRPVAETLAADHPERIEVALQAIDKAVASGWKARSMSASVIDAVRDPAKWGYAVQKPVVKAPAKRRVDPEPTPAPADPRGTALTMLRVKLSRPLSPMAEMALQELDEVGVAALNDALRRPAKEALPLATAILNAAL